MFRLIKVRLDKELSHYRALSDDLRHLLISYYLYLIAYPLFAVFTNAYLWRHGESLVNLVVFNLFYCLGLPTAFYLNGLALKKFHTLKLYGLGAILEGFSGVLVVFFSSTNLFNLALYGLVAGLGGGLYWANKNYLSLRLTSGSNRLYYNTIESSGDMLINMIVPALAGLIITFGLKSSLYSLDLGYKISMALGFVAAFFSGWLVQKSQIKDVDHEPMFIRKVTPAWNKVRLYNFLFNITVGAEFVLPSVLILTVVGDESILGLISSITSIFSAIALYLLGRIGNHKNIWMVVAVGSLIYLTSGAMLLTGISQLTVIFYSVASTIGWALRWSPSYTVVMETMDQENKELQYAYVCDNEMFFNLGRIGGLTLIVLFNLIHPVFALQYIPLAVGLFALVSLIPLRQLSLKV